MLAERSCVYNMLINLMETREAGKSPRTTEVFSDFFSTNLYLYYPEANLSEHCLMFTCPFCCVCSTAIISDYLGKGLHFLFK